MTERESVFVHVIDPKKALELLADKYVDKIDIERYNVHVEQMVIVNGRDGIATVCNEGVGWPVDKDGKVPVNYWGINGFNGYVDLPVEEAKSLVSEEVVDLAKFIRVFGHRLENNFHIWKNYVKGFEQSVDAIANA